MKRKRRVIAESYQRACGLDERALSAHVGSQQHLARSPNTSLLELQKDCMLGSQRERKSLKFVRGLIA